MAEPKLEAKSISCFCRHFHLFKDDAGRRTAAVASVRLVIDTWIQPLWLFFSAQICMQCYRKLYSQNTCTQAWPRMLHCVAGCNCILHTQAWLWMLHCIWLDKIAYSTHKLDPECCTACCRMWLHTPHTSMTQNVALHVAGCDCILHTQAWPRMLLFVSGYDCILHREQQPCHLGLLPASCAGQCHPDPVSAWNHHQLLQGEWAATPLSPSPVKPFQSSWWWVIVPYRSNRKTHIHLLLEKTAQSNQMPSV